MNELLGYIVKYCSDLFEKYRFKFVDSDTSDSFGDAYVTLASDSIFIRFVRDRGQMRLDIQSKYQKRYRGWHSLDVVRQLITNEKEYHSILDAKNGIFLQKNLEKIVNLFSENNAQHTLTELSKLEKIRTKTMYTSWKSSGND